MACARGAAAADASANAEPRVMLSTAVVGSVEGPGGQQILVAEPRYNFAAAVPRAGHAAGTDGVAAGPYTPSGALATTVCTSDCLASMPLLPQELLPQPIVPSPVGQDALPPRRCLRPPPGLTAMDEKEGEGSAVDSDGCSTTATSHVASPNGGAGSADGTSSASHLSSPAGTFVPEASSAPTLCLENAGPQVLLAWPELPSMGSRRHHLGTCKPCAFVFKGGCANGVACSFCHLCPPGEKKMRKMERKANRRGLSMWQMR